MGWRWPVIDRTMPVSAFAEAVAGEKLSPFWRRMLDNPPTVQDRIDAEVRRRRQMREMLWAAKDAWTAARAAREKTDEP